MSKHVEWYQPGYWQQQIRLALADISVRCPWCDGNGCDMCGQSGLVSPQLAAKHKEGAIP
jgi:hypothetical protein